MDLPIVSTCIARSPLQVAARWSRLLLPTLVCVLAIGIPREILLGQWQPKQAPLMTRWAADVNPQHVHAEYPRPQFVREQWTNLNGLWDYAIVGRDATTVTNYEGQILVPFPVQSALSGVMKPVSEHQALWYRRTFERPVTTDGHDVLLHFGAVDWDTRVWVNGHEVGSHRGGYDPWSCSIGKALTPSGPQEIVVRVEDPTDAGYQPRGKQVREPEGIWYTAVTGIWQTVWLETVPTTRLDHAKVTPRLSDSSWRCELTFAGSTAGHTIRVTVRGNNQQAVAETKLTANTAEINVGINQPRWWSPSDPFLYDLQYELLNGQGQVVDQVTSYAAMREISAKADEQGRLRMALNGQPLFQLGPLDQGWWPDGLYTAPSDAALKYDLEKTKQLGFNMCRKHVKVEPERWYYWCDKLGLLVWQDMPNGDRHISETEPDIERTAESAANYRREWQAIIDARYNHPCIVVWVPFNEGWGQFATADILQWTKHYDPSRLTDGPSGWTDRGTGDMHDMHRYPGPAMFPVEPQRISVLGEFGGLGLPLDGHLWWNKRNWGYRTYHTSDELQKNYEQLLVRLPRLIGQGLAAAIYTQTTDVEGEVNGLMTYDRAVVKLDAKRLTELHAQLYQPMKPIRLVEIVPTSERRGQTWKWTTSDPGKSWSDTTFDDSQWASGEGGFGTKDTPGAIVRTEWKSEDIWLRRTFELKDGLPQQPQLAIHHDETAEVYINGHLVATLEGHESSYIDWPLVESARAAFQVGRNVLAVHCHQTRGGQYIDVGIQDVREE